jgi:hypothetical protein
MQLFETKFEKARRLIQSAENASGLPVRVTWDNNLNVGAVLHLSEASFSKQLRISVNPERPDITYLIGLQCETAIRFYNQHETKHLIATEINKIKTINDFIALGFDKKSAEINADKILLEIGRQIRSSAPQIQITSTIYRDYPELRENQYVHFMYEQEKCIESLSIDEKIFPKWILKSHQAMNGANALVADYLFEKNDFFEPFKKKGFESICVKLIGSVMDSNSNTPDTQLVNEWIELLDLEEFFEWRIL